MTHRNGPHARAAAGGPSGVTGQTVAILHVDAERARVLRLVLEAEGMRVLALPITDIEHQDGSLQTVLQEYHPRVVLYDLSPPLENHLAFFRLLRRPEAMRGTCLVVMTTEPRALQEELNHPAVCEVIELPATVGEVAAAVGRASSCTASGSG
jgi:CheY-like chemotaxis protein